MDLNNIEISLGNMNVDAFASLMKAKYELLDMEWVSEEVHGLVNFIEHIQDEVVAQRPELREIVFPGVEWDKD